MNHPSTRQQVTAALSQIIALPLSAARRAADMRILQFGTMCPVNGGVVGDFALHIQCPWRIDGPDGILTGRLDLWEPYESSPQFDYEEWDYEKSPNLQDSRIDRWLKQYGSSLIVKRVDAGEYGGACIYFERDFVLRLFPAGTQGEDWRLLRPKMDVPHFVVSGGKVEASE